MKPCLIPDFDGDDCDFWVEKYEQRPCSNCLERRQLEGKSS